MATIISSSSIADVLCYFQDIKGHISNPGLPNQLRRCQIWKQGILTLNEFANLECQTEPRKLLKDIEYNNFLSKRLDVGEKLGKLNSGNTLDFLIVREKIETDPLNKQSSFYLEDGTGRSVAIKKYLEDGKEYKITAFIGSEWV